MSKARDLADSAQEINILDGKSFLDEDNLASDSATGIASQQSIKAYVDGITTTNITSTGALNSGSITSGFGNIDNGSSTITTTGAISGGSFVIGSADINENDLESIDGITAGTVSASKAVVVNTNKDITGFRNITATGTISGSLSGTLSGAIASTTTATTQAESDDSTKVATTEYVSNKITTLIGGAPSTLNDLNELAAAINDDANYNTTLTTALATKLPLAGGTMTGDVLYNDNIKAKFGAGSDLQIYHDAAGGHSRIDDVGTGNLVLRAAGALVVEKYGGDTMANFANDGAVTLYHDNAAKIATTATGIDVTGTITSDNGSSTTVLSGNSLVFDRNSANYIRTSDASGYLRLQTGSGDTAFFSANGDISFYEDTGTTAKFFWDASTERLGLGTSSPANKMHIYNGASGVATSAANTLTIENTGVARMSLNAPHGSDRSIMFGNPKDAGGNYITQGGTESGTYDNDYLRFVVGNRNVMQLFNGNVGIGVTSPDNKLVIASGSDGTGNGDGVAFYGSGSNKQAAIKSYNAGGYSGDLRFYTGNKSSASTSVTEHMRIDASGYVVIGSTVQGSQNAVTIGQAGFVQARRASGAAGFFDRLTDDGTIIQLRKGGADVGVIRAEQGDIAIGTGDVMLRFNDGSDCIQPRGTDGAVRDNAIDLGSTSQRFKKVYATDYRGDGSNLTGVGGSTTAGDVGTYAAAWQSGSGAYGFGSTRSGSGLRAGNFFEMSGEFGFGTTSFSGTWRCMGNTGIYQYYGSTSNDGNQWFSGTVWLRIS